MSDVNRSCIAKLLVAEGNRIYRSHSKYVEFTKDPNANALLNDLKGRPHAFVLGCLMDRQIKAERAWSAPYQISRRLGTFNFKKLAQLNLGEIVRLMTRPEPLHRFHREMSKNIFEAVKLIASQYGGDAGKIWADRPSSAEVVHRFLQFRGIGPKIATMAANILARNFKIPFSDYYSIDVSVDTQVRRVFRRLGLVGANADDPSIIYSARALNPVFPGLLDLPAWEIGRKWCRPRKPLCDQCTLRTVCPSANSGG